MHTFSPLSTKTSFSGEEKACPCDPGSNGLFPMVPNAAVLLIDVVVVLLIDVVVVGGDDVDVVSGRLDV